MNSVSQDTEERYRLLIEHSRDLICELGREGDMKGRFLYLSPNYPQVLGYEPEELLYTDAFALVHPDDLAGALVKFAGRSETATLRYRHKNGSWLWLECSGQVFKTAGNEERGVIISRDVTERVADSQRTLDSEANMGAAQEMMHAGSWELDLADLENPGKNALHWSDEVYRIFGYQPGELEVSNEVFFRAVHPDDRAMVQAAVTSALENRTQYSIVWTEPTATFINSITRIFS